MPDQLSPEPSIQIHVHKKSVNLNKISPYDRHCARIKEPTPNSGTQERIHLLSKEPLKAGPVKPELVGARGASNHLTTDEKPQNNDFTFRHFKAGRPEILAIGSSTGGPIAVKALLKAIGPELKRLPVIITQHMPPLFTPVFAANLSEVTGLPGMEGADGIALEKGTIYVAPGDYHMVVVNRNNRPTLSLNQRRPVNFCRPSVEPMFSSLPACYGSKILAVVLTGMGADGSSAVVDIADAGGNVLAQNEQSSMVWGMPKAAALSGACFAVQSIDRMAMTIRNVISRGSVQ